MAAKVNKCYTVYSPEITKCRAEYQIFAGSKKEARLLFAIREGVSESSVYVESLGRPYTPAMLCPILRPHISESAGVTYAHK